VGFLVLVLSVFSLGFPWYFMAVKDPTGQTNCEILELTSWVDRYCYSRGDCPSVVGDECPTSTNWQDACNGASGCDDRKRTFDVTLALVALSTFCALFVWLGFCIRCCSSNYKRRNPLHTIMTFVSLASLVTAIVYFAIQTPKTNCDVLPVVSSCNQLWGYSSQLNLTFGPAGWAAACFTSLILFIALCMSCQRSSDEMDLGTYYSMGEHVEGSSHARRSQSHNHHNYTSASTSYVG